MSESGLGNSRPTPRTTSAVTKAASDYVAAFYAFYPHRATWTGWHAHDGQIPDATPAAVAARMRALADWAARLHELGTRTDARHVAGNLSAARYQADRLELAILEHARREELFRLQRWRQYQTDPRAYYSALDVSVYVTRLFAPPRERLQSLTAYVRGVPDLLVAAHEQFDRSLSLPILASSIVTYRALASYYRSGLEGAGVALAATDREREEFRAVVAQASASLDATVQSLMDRLSDAHDDFRLGEDWLLAFLQETELLTYSLDELRVIGNAALQRHQAHAEAVAEQLGLPLVQALARLDPSTHRPREMLGVASQTVSELRALFASGAVVAPLPPDDVCEVRAMPAHLPAGAALFEGPGVFDTHRMPGILYLTVPQPWWTPAQRRTQMTRLTPWALRNTVAHEVMPGHHLHWYHMARVRSLAARAFPSLGSIEGWAHYAEELVLTYGDAENPRNALAHLRMGLLRNCRFLMALELHAGTASIDEAAAFIARRTGFGPIRAREEALRGVLDPGYLNYTLGKALLLELREAYAARLGSRYTPRRFHDALLAQGALPIPLLRQALLSTSAP